MIKNNIKWVALMIAVAFAFTACEDPEEIFDPVNPDLTEDAILGTPKSAERVITGLERQLSLVFDELAPPAEIASDNYVNVQTFYNQFLDQLDIDATDQDIEDSQFDIARLRELALFGRDRIGPADPGITNDLMAEFDYFLGVSYLLAGQYFATLPAEPLGVPLSSEENLKLAIATFQAGADKTDVINTKVACLLGIARAQYLSGEKGSSVAAADQAIALAPDFVRYVQHDVLNGPDNNLQDAIHDRGTFDDLQPLPRLDFLDPKYNDEDPGNDIDIALFKIEEAHLIKCEAAIADGALGDAQSIMKDIIGLVATRPTSTFGELAENRTQRNPNSRPNLSAVTVAASPGAPFRAGLVLDRTDATTVPTISGTSVTNEMVDMVGSEDEALALLYLMRQEIFIAECQRITDMGIKLIVSQVEQLGNPNIQQSDITSTLPSFLEVIKGEIDAMTYDSTAATCVITHDINAIIVANKTSDAVCPFH